MLFAAAAAATTPSQLCSATSKGQQMTIDNPVLHEYIKPDWRARRSPPDTRGCTETHEGICATLFTLPQASKPAHSCNCNYCYENEMKWNEVPKAGCLPQLGMMMYFCSPMQARQVRKIIVGEIEQGVRKWNGSIMRWDIQLAPWPWRPLRTCRPWAFELMGVFDSPR